MSVDTALSSNLTLSEQDFLKDPSIGVNSSILSVKQSTEERWNLWFQIQPALQEKPPSDDPFLLDYLPTIIPESSRESQENHYLRLAFCPIDNDLLKVAQIRILMQFQSFLHSSNDAISLQSLLHNRLFCTLSSEFAELVPLSSYAGDFFRLVLLYIHPILTLHLDTVYQGWEDTMTSLLMDPTQFLTQQQLFLVLESFQACQHHSPLWLIGWFAQTLSLYTTEMSLSTTLSASHPTFESFLQDALCEVEFVTPSSISTFLSKLPSSSPERIISIFSILNQTSLFALPSYFQDIVGPVLTTENRYKQLLPHHPPINQTIAVLDVRKTVVARNDFVNLVDGCIETTLYSTFSSSHSTCIHYANVPFSSSHAEGNQYLTASHGQQHPLIILADTPMEGSFVALLLQKHGRSFVSLSASESSSPQDFPHLLDLLLSTDYSTPKPSFPIPHGLFGGWSWWRGWTNPSDQETSSSEVYQSGSNEEERIVVSSAGGTISSLFPFPPLNQSTTKHILPSSSSSSTTAAASSSHISYPIPTKESHSRVYFSTIHSYLDNVLSEVNSLSTNALLSSELLTIVHNLIYTHTVTILGGEGLIHHTHSIDTICSGLQQKQSKSVETISSQSSFPNEDTKFNQQLQEKDKEGKTADLINSHSITSPSMLSSSFSNQSSIHTIPEGFADDGISKSVESNSHSISISSGHSQSTSFVEEEKEKEKEKSQSPPTFSSIPCGQYLLVLTDYKCILLLPSYSHSILSPNNQFNHSTSHSVSTESTGEEEEEIIQTILSTFLPIFTDYEITFNSSNQCDQYQIVQSYDLHDLELMNILVQEEAEQLSSPSQIIHIRFSSEENLFLQVDYAIFVVNEIMKRLTNLH